MTTTSKQTPRKDETTPVYENGKLVGWCGWAWGSEPKKVRVFIPCGDVE